MQSLSKLSEKAKTDSINNLISNINNNVAQLDDIALAKKKNEILTTLDNGVVYPNLKTNEEKDQVEALNSLSNAPALLEKLATKNELLNLDKKIQAAQDVLSKNGAQIQRINPAGKQDLENEITNATNIKTKTPSATKQEILDKIKLLDQKMDAVSQEKLIRKLREQKIQEITNAQPNNISQSNLQKLIDKIENPRLSTEDEINDAFSKAKYAKDKLQEIKQLSSLSPDAQNNLEEKIINAAGNNSLVDEIKNVAIKQNTLLQNFDSTYDKLNKQNERSDIESLNSLQELTNKEKELKSKNSKIKLQEIVDQANAAKQDTGIYSKAEDTKRTSFDQKLQEAEQALQGDLKDSKVYDDLANGLKPKIDDVKLPTVLNYQKQQAEALINTYQPVLTSDQAQKLKEKVKSDTIKDLNQLDNELNKVKDVKEKIDEINLLQTLSNDAKQKAYGKLIDHYGDTSNQALDLQLAKQKDELLKQIQDKQNPYNNLNLDQSIRTEIENATDSNKLDELKQKYAIKNRIEDLKKLKDESEQYKNTNSNELTEADPEGKTELEKQITEAQNIINKGDLNKLAEVENKISELKNAYDAVQKEKYLKKFRDKKVQEISKFNDVLSGNNIRDLNAKVTDQGHNTVALIKAEFEKAKKVHENAQQLNNKNELSSSIIEAAKNNLVSNYDNQPKQTEIVKTINAKQDLLASFNSKYPNLLKADKKQQNWEFRFRRRC
ncbi:hypothetical protein [Mycoplasma struthionis]|uniref:Uncharacterized protein n=1 Tax=Mycoplasma struthionis TaxID=538220 RepID=A0A502M819_9MOLU|nr:hypothetical protein [Mycoplasma struthionis]TPI02808.1 hypothetical protein FJM01_00235 [Mycoplasma struthionis]